MVNSLMRKTRSFALSLPPLTAGMYRVYFKPSIANHCIPSHYSIRFSYSYFV
ncbi:unnamed protein product [Linum tenue]|uniref:Uncharacterized protein n=1 Tax=Linum tenue TaxID=586396 RepID=A0AAV0LE64_9ROSI|nr:unnamed protein product [Linum tenue]